MLHRWQLTKTLRRSSSSKVSRYSHSNDDSCLTREHFWFQLDVPTLIAPRIWTKLDDRKFAAAAIGIKQWNSLPVDFRGKSVILPYLAKLLKTHLRRKLI